MPEPGAESRPSIPRPTARRLSLYLRELERGFGENGHLPTTVSSRMLAESLGLTDAQVRKDLAVIGQSGQPGIGYRTETLAENLRSVLGTDRSRNVCVVGVGNLGRAVASYARLKPKGFAVRLLVDRDPELVGTELLGMNIVGLDQLETAVAEHSIEIAVLTVPATEAQSMAQRLVAAGVTGILNFAPVRLHLDDAVSVVDVDLTLSLEQLTHRLTHSLNGAVNGDRAGD